MATTATAENGHADSAQPTADGGHAPTRNHDQPKPAKVQLLVERTTRDAVSDTARRLGRSQDQIVAAGVALLNQRTQEQRAKTKQEWLNEITGDVAS